MAGTHSRGSWHMRYCSGTQAWLQPRYQHSPGVAVCARYAAASNARASTADKGESSTSRRAQPHTTRNTLAPLAVPRPPTAGSRDYGGRSASGGARRVASRVLARLEAVAHGGALGVLEELVLRVLAVVHARHLRRALQVAHECKRVHVARARADLRAAPRAPLARQGLRGPRLWRALAMRAQRAKQCKPRCQWPAQAPAPMEPALRLGPRVSHPESAQSRPNQSKEL